MATDASIVATQLWNEFLTAESEADREAIRPAAIEAVEGALDEEITEFRQGTFKILALSTKLSQAIENIGSASAKERLVAIQERLSEIASAVHDKEGMRTTWQTNEEFEEVFDDEKDVPPATDFDVIPVGAPVNGDLSTVVLSTSRQFGDLADEYITLFRKARYRDAAAEKAAKDFAKTAFGNKSRYQEVGQQLRIPWWFIAGVHLLEASFNFSTHLHNGDRLTARTFRVPAGRPKNGTPPFTWEQSAIDALKFEDLDNLQDWSLARALYRWEAFNGFGYRSRRIATPYLWSFSNNYSKGKYIGDGVFSPTAVSKQCGAAAFLKALVGLGHVSLEIGITTEGDGEATESDPASAEEVVDQDKPNIDGVISGNVDFKTFFDTNLPDVKHFQWHEFLVKGSRNATSGLNTDPPMALWSNILQVARILDRFREEIGHSVVLTSVYRSPAYNATLPGAAKSSQHMQFKAVDFKVVGAGTPRDWAKIIRSYRSQKMFEGGVGVYDTFVHVDTRGHNVDW
ncbi:Peptidase M15A (plasmid) [Rhizobium leguminosarum bv. trifolii WSM1325]|uniref:Peptidase M15A n=1 Tax=Rhizobium leguminosarum bv. trifolii (strain WSM1325) TaxID=395491 RepID=C6BB49_RHILS|nr:D-Ala-D-Ala carboxypeptidase family metallohydrolase [Rhizobium leguminosarum]ACS61307.1 Peptidase M15A [Rhizobium leguminosarum bv. trifolii WSM1325]